MRECRSIVGMARRWFRLDREEIPHSARCAPCAPVPALIPSVWFAAPQAATADRQCADFLGIPAGVSPGQPPNRASRRRDYRQCQIPPCPASQKMGEAVRRGFYLGLSPALSRRPRRRLHLRAAPNHHKTDSSSPAPEYRISLILSVIWSVCPHRTANTTESAQPRFNIRPGRADIKDARI